VRQPAIGFVEPGQRGVEGLVEGLPLATRGKYLQGGTTGGKTGSAFLAPRSTFGHIDLRTG
jgi:hypothetical protein